MPERHTSFETPNHSSCTSTPSIMPVTFENEDEMQHIRRSIEAQIELLPKLVGNDKTIALRQCEWDLKEGEVHMRQMHSEVSMMSAVDQRVAKERLRVLQRDWQVLGEAVSAAKNAPPDTRMYPAKAKVNDSNIGNTNSTESDSHYPDDPSHKDRLLLANERLNRTSDRLENCQRIAVETEEIGVGVLGSLQSQRTQLQSSRDQLYRLDENVSLATRVLKSMERSIMADKCMRWIVIASIIVLLALMLYYYFVLEAVEHKGGNGNEATPHGDT